MARCHLSFYVSGVCMQLERESSEVIPQVLTFEYYSMVPALKLL